MGSTNWQRELMATLTRLETTTASLQVTTAEIRSEMTEMRAELRGEMTEMRAELRGEMAQMRAEFRGDMRTLTRLVVRRFGTDGSAAPQKGDHVLYHVKPELVMPAVVLRASGERLDLEVFGTAVGPERFPSGVSQGIAPGCWSFPG